MLQRIRRDREIHAYGSACRTGINHQQPVKLPNALPHAPKTNPGPAGLDMRQLLGWNSSPVVLNFQCHAIRIAADPDLRSLAAGVAVNIRERLLDDAEQDELHFGGKTAKILRNGEIDLQQSPVHEACDIPAQSAGQTAFL